MNDTVKTCIVAALIGLGVFFALRGFDSQSAPGVCPTGCDCGHERERSGLLPINELPEGVSKVQSLGNGWVSFQLELAGYRRLFIYRNGGSICELSHAAQYVGGTGAAGAKPTTTDAP